MTLPGAAPTVAPVPDPVFEHPRLIGIYDALDPDRSDLDVHLALVEQLGARSVLDVGCGTGTFALVLAARGIEVTGVDPAGGSLDVARAEPGADRAPPPTPSASPRSSCSNGAGRPPPSVMPRGVPESIHDGPRTRGAVRATR